MTTQSADKPILEWVLVGLAVLWFTGVALATTLLFSLAGDSPASAVRQMLIVICAGGLQLGGLLIFVGIAHLNSGWHRLSIISQILIFATTWTTIEALLHQQTIHHPVWTPVLQLSLGVPLFLLVGGGLVAYARRTNLLSAWREMGLTHTGSLGWGFAAAALILFPWFLVGSLGDFQTSIRLFLQSTVEGLLTEWLWRGLALSMLISLTDHRWKAGFLGGLLYIAYAVGRMAYMEELDTNGPLTAAAIAFLATELWARAGPERPGIGGAVVFHALFLAFPRLFADPRTELEWSHMFVRATIPFATLALATILFSTRKLWVRFFSPLPPSHLRGALIASIAWTGALGIYLVGGAPGFFNDGYLIILKEQANLDDVPRSNFYHVLVETAQSSQAPIRHELDEMNISYRPYYLVNMIRVDGTTKGMQWMKDREDVNLVLLNPNMRKYPGRWTEIGYEKARDSEIGLPWGIDSIDAELVWELGYTGQGIIVAGQDTGYNWFHPALIANYRGWNSGQIEHNGNWHDAWDNQPVPFDDEDHGTHTMGTAVGKGVGVAPDAKWIGCRNMRHGIGNPGSYVECMEFFFAPYPFGSDPFVDGEPELAPHIVVNSWGCPIEEGCIDPEPIHTAVKVLREAGIMMVVSAGNEGPACSTVGLPASEDDVLSVGAVDESMGLVDFSSRGPAPDGTVKPEVVAPGVNIVSSIPGGAYGYAGGTSMAGPHVAGLVALLWSANPDLIGEIDKTEQIIFSSSQPLKSPDLCPAGDTACDCGQDLANHIPNNLYGNGVVDALAAVQTAIGK